MELCECGHRYESHLWAQWVSVSWGSGSWNWTPGACGPCGCPEYKPRHDARYDPDDVADQGYSDEGFPYSGLGKVRR